MHLACALPRKSRARLVAAARGWAEAGRVLDDDLLLVHLADPEALSRRLSRC